VWKQTWFENSAEEVESIIPTLLRLNSCQAVCALSSAPFSVVAPLTVAAPNGGEIWARGSAQTITWTNVGLTGNVNIALLKAGAGLLSLGSVPVANGTLSWTVPANLTPGADYTIRITSASNGAIVDVSNAAFTIN
jgi:Ser-Thr-rich glycosyl-phosphatidyl-inositol-anchored membrane family protein